MQEETKENTEPVTEQTHESVEIDGMEKEVFAKADESVFLKDGSLFSTNRRNTLFSQLFSPLLDADTSFGFGKGGAGTARWWLGV